jgi:serine/threonine protein kinase/formylglycine-generating enzyme required for sulfatase activity
MKLQHCPPQQQLAEFFSGRTDDSSAESVHEHVSECLKCQAALVASCVNDSVIYSIKKGISSSEYENEQAFRRAIIQLNEIGLGVDTSQNDARPITDATVDLNQDLMKSASIDDGTIIGSASFPKIAGYEILEMLGRGGMGIVYKARQRGLNRIVALKMILTGIYASSVEIARFRAEAEAIARLHHPNIVHIYEIGDAGGHYYFSLEFLDGGSLAHLLRGVPQPPLEAAKLIIILAEAIQFAHSKGIVHRDLKPANILLDKEHQVNEHVDSVSDSKRSSKSLKGQRLVCAIGIPKIADFGLAKQLEVDSDFTTTGSILGSPSYMAPEQASGQLKKIGPSADIYSLGAILYDLLVGRPPFRAATVIETLEQVRHEDAVPPRRLLSRIPIDLETICMKCLEKDSEKRYASAFELAEDLRRFIAGEPILARPVNALERTIRWIRRNPTIAGALVTVVLTLTLATTISLLKYLDAEKQRQVAKNDTSKALLASEYIASIFELADANGMRGTMTTREILADAERSIPLKFADQPELREKLLIQVGQVQDKLDADSPLAMILAASGGVQLHAARSGNQNAMPQALLYGGDRLHLAQDGQVQLMILFDLHKERLQPGVETTISRKGCEPGESVREREQDILTNFVHLPKGSFYMGGGGGVAGSPTEIKEDFEIAAHLITQGQWRHVMGNNPSSFSRFGPDYDRVQNISDGELSLFPVECVSEEDIQKFVGKLNELTQGSGWRYRLPTSAEWEYACRAGAMTEEACSYHFYFSQPSNDISSLNANFNGKLPFGDAPQGLCMEKPMRVGLYPPNQIGLYDMHGNLSQWCSDSEGHRRVHRGGAWGSDGFHCRAAESNVADRWERNRAIGFRLVRTKP